MAQPLTDAITALTRYANETTGQSDQTLSDAVWTLCDGYGGGGSSVDDVLGELAMGNVPSGNVVFSSSVTRIGQYSFTQLYDQVNAWTLNAPYVTFIGNGGFRGNKKLTEAYFPRLTSVGGTSYTFYECSNLEIVDLGESNLLQNELTRCSKLKTVILRKSSVQTLVNVSCFNNTPFATNGTGGTVYVPQALISSYQTASNWSTLYDAGTCTFVALEGSEYE